MNEVKNADSYKTALEIILALCERAGFKSSDMETIQLICETTLKKED